MDSDDGGDEVRFNGTSFHEGHLHQNGVITWLTGELDLASIRLNELSHTINWKSPKSILGKSGYIV